MSPQKFSQIVFNLTFVFLLALSPAMAKPVTATGAAASTVRRVATIIRVTEGGAREVGCGTAWDDASACELHYALQTQADSGDEIWIKAGTYKPNYSGIRAATFKLREGVAVYGGFAGSETAREQRDWRANEVILSGDLAGNDGPNFSGNEENSYHVVTGANDALLDGVTIQSGNANGPSPNDTGSGIYSNQSSPTLINVIITGNSAIAGGGMANLNNSHAVLTNVVFSRNASSGAGAGMYNHESSPTLTNVSFFGNATLGKGGGMANSNSSPTLTNVSFGYNAAFDSGGAIYNWDNSNPVIHNSILWGDGDEIFNYSESDVEPSNPVVSSSDVMGGYPGPGNIDADPLLQEDNNLVNGLALLPGSPAMNAATTGCPETDWRGVARAAICDLGAFESQGFTLTITDGNNQSTSINTPFAQSLVVSITANDPSEPVFGGQVTFTSPASGASASLSPNPVSIAGETATTTATANNTPGNYPVIASLPKAASKSFSLRNLLDPAGSMVFLPVLER